MDRRGHPDRADLITVRLVIRTQHRASRMLRCRRHLRVAEDDQRFGDHQSDAALLAGLRNVQTAQRRVVAHRVRRVAVRHLKHEIAAIQIDR